MGKLIVAAKDVVDKDADPSKIFTPGTLFKFEGNVCMIVDTTQGYPELNGPKWVELDSYQMNGYESWVYADWQKWELVDDITIEV
jgi:hypothetical protein